MGAEQSAERPPATQGDEAVQASPQDDVSAPQDGVPAPPPVSLADNVPQDPAPTLPDHMKEQSPASPRQADVLTSDVVPLAQVRSMNLKVDLQSSSPAMSGRSTKSQS